MVALVLVLALVVVLGLGLGLVLVVVLGLVLAFGLGLVLALAFALALALAFALAIVVAFVLERHTMSRNDTCDGTCGWYTPEKCLACEDRGEAKKDLEWWKSHCRIHIQLAKEWQATAVEAQEEANCLRWLCRVLALAVVVLLILVLM